MDKISAALLSSSAVIAAAVIGGRHAPSPQHPRTALWYAKLNKPGFTPPGPVFGGAWSALYPLLGWAGYRLLAKPPSPQRTVAVAAWGANVAGVALHPYLFFGRKELGPALAELTVETAAAIALVAAASRVDRSVALAQVPLALWTAFADLLNEEVWRRN